MTSSRKKTGKYRMLIPDAKPERRSDKAMARAILRLDMVNTTRRDFSSSLFVSKDSSFRKFPTSWTSSPFSSSFFFSSRIRNRMKQRGRQTKFPTMRTIAQSSVVHVFPKYTNIPPATIGPRQVLSWSNVCFRVMNLDLCPPATEDAKSASVVVYAIPHEMPQSVMATAKA